MQRDSIKEIAIDSAGRLCVFPAAVQFPFIYRAAAEVSWSPDGHFLYSPKPKEWSYFDWFTQIVAVTQGEYGCQLSTTPGTVWRNIPAELKAQILAYSSATIRKAL